MMLDLHGKWYEPPNGSTLKKINNQGRVVLTDRLHKQQHFCKLIRYMSTVGETILAAKQEQLYCCDPAC